jgi:hypothetical protein
MKGIRRGTIHGYSLYSFKVYGHAQITSPYLNSILINPANTSIKIGEEVQFKAEGTSYTIAKLAPYGEKTECIIVAVKNSTQVLSEISDIYNNIT